MGFFAPDAGFGTGLGYFFWFNDGSGTAYMGLSYARPAYTINLNENFIGIADAAISDTATGSVTIKGGIATNTSLPTLTPNSVYYVQGDGTISTTSTSPAVRLGKGVVLQQALIWSLTRDKFIRIITFRWRCQRI